MEIYILWYDRYNTVAELHGLINELTPLSFSVSL
jgi:hypothetical protein